MVAGDWLLAVSSWLVLLSPVGTHDSCVRCVKGYSIVVLTETDARAVRPYKAQFSIVTRICCRSSLWILAVVLIATPACHVVFDVVRYVVSFSLVPNNTIVIP